jgi:hypothetical protein
MAVAMRYFDTSDTLAPPEERARPRTTILAPGRNCWRIEMATRAAFLVDGQEFFGAVRAALSRARHSFFILGWMSTAG